MQDGRREVKTSSTNGTVGAEDSIASPKADRTRAARNRRRILDEDEARRALASTKKLYFRIGEVSLLTGVKAHVLRYWETEFRWMAPPKSRSKQRLYRKRDIEFVWLLKKLLWDQRYTIAGARQRIQELGLDEALTRCADAESLDATIQAAGIDPVASGAEGSPQIDAEGSASSASRDRGQLRIALEAMQSELLELRGALVHGL